MILARNIWGKKFPVRCVHKCRELYFQTRFWMRIDVNITKLCESEFHLLTRQEISVSCCCWCHIEYKVVGKRVETIQFNIIRFVFNTCVKWFYAVLCIHIFDIGKFLIIFSCNSHMEQHMESTNCVELKRLNESFQSFRLRVIVALINW